VVLGAQGHLKIPTDYYLIIAFYYLNHGLLIIVFNLYQK
jgi:hypothetical protein